MRIHSSDPDLAVGAHLFSRESRFTPCRWRGTVSACLHALVSPVRLEEGEHRSDIRGRQIRSRCRCRHSCQDSYVAVLEAGTGRRIDSATFPTTANGLSRALTWMVRRAPGRALVAVEGAGSYGAGLAVNVDVCDVHTPKRESHAGRGKSDEIDAIAAARTALATDVELLITPRADGLRAALRVLLVARQAMGSRRTADRNTLTALLRSFDLGIDARRPLTDEQVATIAAWRHRAGDDAASRTIRDEAHRLATAVLGVTGQLVKNSAALAEHVETLAPGLHKCAVSDRSQPRSC